MGSDHTKRAAPPRPANPQPPGAPARSPSDVPPPRPEIGSWPEISARLSSAGLFEDALATEHPSVPPRAMAPSHADALALQRISARLEALPAAALRAPAIDPRTCAVAALMVANHAARPEITAGFEALEAARLCTPHALADLPVLARFVLRILTKMGPDLVEVPGAGPPELEEACRAERATLLDIAERHLSDIDEAHGRMATVRLGRTSADVVFDLRMLADLCQDYGTELTRRAAFTPAQAVRARELAERLEEALVRPQDAESREWRTYLLRAWSALVETYAEVQRAGRFLFSKDQPEARYPSLAAVMRVRRRVKRETPLLSEPQIPDAPITLPFPVASSPEVALVEDGPARSSRDEFGMAVLLGRNAVPPSTADLSSALLEEAASSSALPSFPPSESGRLPLTLELGALGESSFYAGLSGEVEGLFIATFVVKAVGTPLVVTVSWPGAAPLKLFGHVAWVREFSPAIETSPGMGMELEGVSPAEREAIQAFCRIRPPLFWDT